MCDELKLAMNAIIIILFVELETLQMAHKKQEDEMQTFLAERGKDSSTDNITYMKKIIQLMKR